MARVAKLPHIRRNELIDCAQALFFQRGYDATTIADIIASAGVSKGGFYHHFDSKESLLEAMSVRLVEEVLVAAEDILKNPDLTALERMNGFFLRAQAWKAQSTAQLRAAFEAVLNPENDILYRRIAKAMWAVIGPYLIAIIREGDRAGQFRSASPELAAEIYLDLALGRQRIIAEAMSELDEGDVAASTDRLEARLHAEEAVMDRILGVPEGSVRLAEPGLVRSILETMRS
jgi:AcrR family transcriptional regulator